MAYALPAHKQNPRTSCPLATVFHLTSSQVDGMAFGSRPQSGSNTISAKHQFTGQTIHSKRHSVLLLINQTIQQNQPSVHGTIAIALFPRISFALMKYVTTEIMRAALGNHDEINAS